MAPLNLLVEVAPLNTLVKVTTYYQLWRYWSWKPATDSICSASVSEGLRLEKLQIVTNVANVLLIPWEHCLRPEARRN